MISFPVHLALVAVLGTFYFLLNSKADIYLFGNKRIRRIITWAVSWGFWIALAVLIFRILLLIAQFLLDWL